MGFPRQEYWSGLPFPSTGESCQPSDQTCISCLASEFFITEQPGKPSVVKNLPANAGDTGDLGSIPRSVRYPRGGNGNHSSLLARKIPWTEEPGRVQSMGLQKSDTTKHTCMHTHAST